MQCGKELGEAHQHIEQLESQVTELGEDKRVLITQLKALQSDNIGDLKNNNDNISSKTGVMSQATKITDNDPDRDSLFPA